MCCSDLGRDWAACDVVLERFARPHGNVENDEDEQQGAHKLKEEAACSDAGPVLARVRAKACASTCCMDVVFEDASVMLSLACGRDIIRQPDARVVAIVVDAHEEETATHDASGDLGRDVHESSGGSEVPAHG